MYKSVALATAFALFGSVAMAQSSGGASASDSAPAPEASAVPVIEGDTPGPYLNITVSGQAKGNIRIDLFEQLAPNHVAQIKALAETKKYDDIVFHRVIEGFMAQTGDVQFGKATGDLKGVGTGQSDKPNLAAEFSKVPYDRGIVGMARSQSPNSANSQFFIMFDEGHFLNEQYTVVGKVVEGLDVLDKIKRGTGNGGAVTGTPDKMTSVTITE